MVNRAPSPNMQSFRAPITGHSHARKENRLGMTGYRSAAPLALPPGELARAARLRGLSRCGGGLPLPLRGPPPSSMRGAGTERSSLGSPLGRAGVRSVTERAFPLRRGTPPATAWPSPLINAGGKNGAKRPRLPLWGSWHGEAVTEERLSPPLRRTPPATAWPSPLINAGARLVVPLYLASGGFSRR